jgi:hypothetical protein
MNGRSAFRSALICIATALLSLSACGESPPEDVPVEWSCREGLYEGTVSTPMGIPVYTALAIREDGSGMLLLDAFRGFFDGPVTVVTGSDSSMVISFLDGDGQEMTGELAVSGDTLSGTVCYADGEYDLTAELTLVLTSTEVPDEETFYAACLFVPADFTVPEGFETGWCRIRMLTVEDVELDYEAVMSSGTMLREQTGGAWPPEDMSLEQNHSDLEMHQEEHLAREAFTYTVVSLDEDSVLGCVYIMPPRPGEEIDAAVQFWLRQNLSEKGMDPGFHQTLRTWIENDWPFETVIYPGREESGS